MGQKYLKLREENAKFGDISEFVQMKGEGTPVTDVLAAMASAIKKELGGDAPVAGDDAKLRPIVHKYLKALSDDVLQDRGFWRYLATYTFYDLVQKRHPKTLKSNQDTKINANWDNYGSLRESIKESYIYRLFVGADLTVDHENRKDPYHLSRVHDVDLWQAHLIRVKSGDNPIYAKALLTWFTNRDSWYKANEQKLGISSKFANYDDNPRTRHLRDLVKRVRALRSNVIHEFLTLKEMNKLLDIEAEKSLKSIEDWGKRKKSSAKKKVRINSKRKKKARSKSKR
jgi:Family of unknown function (DUF6339)